MAIIVRNKRFDDYKLFVELRKLGQIPQFPVSTIRKHKIFVLKTLYSVRYRVEIFFVDSNDGVQPRQVGTNLWLITFRPSPLRLSLIGSNSAIS